MLEIDFSDESKIGTCYGCKKENVEVFASWTYICFLCKDCIGN